MSRWSHPVAGFWAGDDLSFIEQMVIRSYLDQGCDFTLYLGHPVGGIPEGTPTRDASEILPQPRHIGANPTRKDLAVWSDLFRFRLLQQRRVIWADLDAYCVRPFDLPSDHVFAGNGSGAILPGVLSLPQDSAALRWITDLIFQDEVVTPWAEPGWVERRRKAGKLGPADLPWGDVGPRPLGHALRLTGEDRHALPPPVFYPVQPATLQALWKPGVPDASFIRPETLSVHILSLIHI